MDFVININYACLDLFREKSLTSIKPTFPHN